MDFLYFVGQTEDGSIEKGRSDDKPLQRQASYRLSYIPLPMHKINLERWGSVLGLRGVILDWPGECFGASLKTLKSEFPGVVFWACYTGTEIRTQYLPAH